MALRTLNIREQMGSVIKHNNAKIYIFKLNLTGCYYMFQHYNEGDRILTNEPCLNCTCHDSMLMCFLKVCPFAKPIGQDCQIEKRPDQCCPIITCPERESSFYFL